MHHSRLAARVLAVAVAASLSIVPVAAPAAVPVGAPAALAGVPRPMADAPPASAYTDPPFGPRCDWHVFGEGERPPLSLYRENPLCVEYAKRDITLDNGGWLRFVLAEPSRFAIAVPSCRYWQRDHWSVQVSTGALPLVTWDGSYWFDKGLGVLAARLVGFRVAGVPAGAGDAANALRPQCPELADAIAAYGATAGETGLVVVIPPVPGCGGS
jgi:hypothetical protein